MPGFLPHRASELVNIASQSDDPDAGDPRNELYRRFVAAARFWQPMAVVMENVAGMLQVGDERVAESVAEDLASCGYRVGYALLNAVLVWRATVQGASLLHRDTERPRGHIPSAPPPSHKVDLPSGYLRPPEAIARFRSPSCHTSRSRCHSAVPGTLQHQ